MKFSIRFAFFLLFLLPVQVMAGWVITGRFIDRDGNTILKRYFIQDNMVKVERFNLIYTCNLKTEDVIIVDPEKLVFVKTTLTEYKAKMKGEKTAKLNALLAIVPEDQRDEYGKLYATQTLREIDLTAYNNDSLTISLPSDTVKLLGHQTRKFVLTQKGQKKQELFYTDDINLSADLNVNAFLQYVYLLEPEDKTVRYMASKIYMDKFKNGLVIRRFIFEDGYRTEWQVNKIEQKNIPSYEFGTPDLCKELTLDKWMAGQKLTDDNYYDDYE